MRLVDASDPNAVHDANALDLIHERLALTNSLCYAVQRSGGLSEIRAPHAAFAALMRWVAGHYPTDAAEPHADDGLDQMVVPAGAESLMVELRAGTTVAWCFHTMTTADTSSELQRDTRSVLESVVEWERVLAPLPTTNASDAAYGPRLGEALAWAAELHAGQTRKGKPEPYLTHLLRVTGLVLKFGGSEDQAIAGVLHDAPEDCGGQPVLAEIGRRFGTLVAQIVKDCSDSLVVDPDGKAPWRERKLRHLNHLARDGIDEAVLVTSCDKIANLEDLVEDLRRDGEITLDRFNGGPDGTRAYYDAMFSLVGPRLPEPARLLFAHLLAELGIPEPGAQHEGDAVSRFAAATEHLTAR